MIFMIRGNKVMFDLDLAILFGVKAKALNQAVKRNSKQFTLDFRLQIIQEDTNKVAADCHPLTL